jgi:hypothetical protein
MNTGHEIADVLDRGTETPSVGDGGRRERVRLPPALAVEKAPDRKLSRRQKLNINLEKFA